jgi:hypothetical protein
MPEDPSVYENDPTHPIPQVDTLDIVAKLRDGGANLVIVVSLKIGPDMRSQQRLQQKINNYRGFILSPEFEAEFGRRKQGFTIIRVALSHGAHPVIIALLENCRSALEKDGIAVQWDTA